MKVATGIIGKDLTINNINDYIVDRKLLISSPGGSLFEGWAIHDYIKGKVDEVGVVGVCASAATIILLAAPIRWGTANSRYLIHNPYTDQTGDAMAMQRAADDLIIEQNILVKRYADITGIDQERLQLIMSKQVYLTPEEAQNINLIHTIKSEIMDLKIVEEKMGFMEKILSKISNKLFIKNMIIQDVNGNELDFGDSITDVSQVIVGSEATIDGQPCEGKYVIGDGTELIFEKGKIIEIVMPIEDKTKELTAENETLKTENSALKTEIKNLKKNHNELRNQFEAEIKNVNEEFTKFKKAFSNGSVHNNASIVNSPKYKKNIIL